MSREDAPRPPPYLPGLQFWHTDALFAFSMSLYFPGPHARHSSLTTGSVLAGVAFFPYHPAEQLLHLVADPPAYLPGSQSMHVKLSLRVPGGHLSQLD